MVWLELFNFMHFIGLAFGLGGATIASIISAKAEKDKEIGKVVMKITPSIIKLIWLGIILLIISGIALSFLVTRDLNKQILIAKHILVIWIIIIGVIIGFKFKKIKNLAPILREKPSLQFLRAKKQVKILSTINLILWYAVTLMGAFV